MLSCSSVNQELLISKHESFLKSEKKLSIGKAWLVILCVKDYVLCLHRLNLLPTPSLLNCLKPEPFKYIMSCHKPRNPYGRRGMTCIVAIAAVVCLGQNQASFELKIFRLLRLPLQVESPVCSVI